MPERADTDVFDIFVVGGGINGCGIARDAAGRGYSVCLAEMNDLASATSSASTKLFHGGLRYLEYFEIRLVREALLERETLLRAMPHISWPMRFVLPYHEDMRFEGTTPTSRILGVLMPWLRGRRPAWLIRLGLFLYDHLGKRRLLPGSSTLDLAADPAGKPLKGKFRKAFEYSDCWVEDSRLVALNARDAAARGATILTRTKVFAANEKDGLWNVTISGEGGTYSVKARMLVNAAGPWVPDVLRGALHLNSKDRVRLVRGSHIVTRRLYEHDKCYFFQGEDGRIIFAIPYETDFTLIGTTDADHDSASNKPVCTEAERDYLCAFASQYFERPVTPDDIVWSYSGVRPLHDDGSGSATAATRDYTLKVDRTAGAPVLNVFGGKITTYRKLAESALEQIGRILGAKSGPWTAEAALPGGDFPVGAVEQLVTELQKTYPFLSEAWARRLIRAYGTDARHLLAGAETAADLGRDFGATLTEREVVWLMDTEFACTAEDIVWRRSKLGLRMTLTQSEALDAWMRARSRPAERVAMGS
ncbi:glycerol-3-phosphate dehydrogenase [Hoeflea olei]|uniref:Glycerol-3-phosphate dehydrogenase n=1 Tax=Hoeflea olei TaxID=1480615 RepID=A0A1C1YU17_9HYPH|nr:glycerol-3-phosphate dehydrogenase [Hoeflea olei]OCW57033.1 glycerol-3-phosphate dehydrogenase [Hoeflea olei]